MTPTSTDHAAAPVVVVATITPLPEHRDAVHAALAEAVPAVHQEPGCTLYSLHEAADRFVMIEQWDSADHLRTHNSAAALRALGPELDGKLAGPLDVVVLSAIPLGDNVKGSLR